MNNKKRMLAAGVILAAVLMLSSCSPLTGPKLNKYEAQYMDYFDTVTSVTLYLESDKAFEETEAWLESELERYHRLYDIYNNYNGLNNIKTINDNAGIVPIVVNSDIIRMIQFSIEQYERTDGKVNIAMGRVLSIWHEYRSARMENQKGAQVPDMVQLLKANEYTDIYQIQIDVAKSTVFLPNENMKLDVGAIAKGYAVQQITEGLRKRGVTSALVSAGGNVKTIGQRGDGSAWRVGIQSPDANSSKGYLYAVSLQDMTLVTSGSYQRYYEVEGVRYHHIINPDTLMPWNEYVSVTILSRDSGMADALSTALFNTPLEEGMALIETLEDTEALWVYSDGEEVYSSGFGKYIDD
ncbi:MAG: FAD:protein FMN transferase [Lachnospiraceae bacterium]